MDSSSEPVELYRQGLAMGSGHVWYVGTENVATAITGNGPRAKANAEFYAAAPVFVRWLLDKLTSANACIDELEEQVEDLDAQVCGVPIGEICRMAQGQATPKDRATITIWLTIEDQRRANSRKENEQ